MSTKPIPPPPGYKGKPPAMQQRLTPEQKINQLNKENQARRQRNLELEQEIAQYAIFKRFSPESQKYLLDALELMLHDNEEAGRRFATLAVAQLGSEGFLGYIADSYPDAYAALTQLDPSMATLPTLTEEEDDMNPNDIAAVAAAQSAAVTGVGAPTPQTAVGAPVTQSTAASPQYVTHEDLKTFAAELKTVIQAGLSEHAQKSQQEKEAEAIMNQVRSLGYVEDDWRLDALFSIATRQTQGDLEAAHKVLSESIGAGSAPVAPTVPPVSPQGSGVPAPPTNVPKTFDEANARFLEMLANTEG